MLARVTQGGARASLTLGYLLKLLWSFSDCAHFVRGCCCGGVALAAESAKPPSGELCWRADCKEHLHSEPPVRHGAAVVRARSARHWARDSAP